MAQAFITAWKLRQQATYFGASSFAEAVSVWTGDADPDIDTPIPTEAIVVRRGESPYQGDMDRSMMTAIAVINKADVTLTRASAGHYGFLTDAESVRWGITGKGRENAAFYQVNLSRIECDNTGSGRERTK